MAGQTNIAQVNPTLANQDGDSTYQGDARTTSGYTSGQTVPSPWLNKFVYQMSTLLQALAWSLAQKGYTVNDGSASPVEVISVSSAVSTLAAMFANLVTAADMAFTHGSGSNSQWIKVGFLNNLIIQWGSVLTDINGGTVNVTFPTAFANAADVSVQVSTLSSTDRITFVVNGSISTTGFQVSNNGSSGFATWFAIGY